MSIIKELGMNDGKRRVNEEVVYNVAQAYSIIDKILNGILDKYDLNLAKFNILMMVKHAGKDKGIAQNELSKLLLVTTSNITRMIDKLEKDKCVNRLPLAGDRRVHLLKITKKGSDILDAVWPEYKSVVDNIIGKGLDAVERNQINALLEKFIEGAK